MSIFSLVFSSIPQLFSIINAAPTIKQLLDAMSNPTELIAAAKKLVPSIIPIVEIFAEQLFPKVAPELRIAAGIMAAYDPNKNKWLQQGLNVILDDQDDIAVDGIYGPATRAAVEKAQAKLGLKVDGWAGPITSTAIQLALNAIFGDAGNAKKVDASTAVIRAPNVTADLPAPVPASAARPVGKP